MRRIIDKKAARAGSSSAISSAAGSPPPPASAAISEEEATESNEGPAEEEDDTPKLQVVIGVNGWLWEQEDVVNNFLPVLDLCPSCEVYSVQWESKQLLDIGYVSQLYEIGASSELRMCC
jgi:hypothetical protein